MVTLAQGILDANGITLGSGRLAAELSVRTVRYYATAGILDSPSRVARSAAYGRRHLYQVLAIRQAQSRGLSLSQIRGELAAKSNEELASYAALDLSLVPEDLGEAPPSPESLAFWERPPTVTHPPAAPAPSSSASLRQAAAPSYRPPGTGPAAFTLYARGVPAPASTPTAVPPHTRRARVTHTVQLGPVAVSLLTPPTATFIRQLEEAAQPLLELVSSADPDHLPYRADTSPTPSTPATQTRRSQ